MMGKAEEKLLARAGEKLLEDLESEIKGWSTLNPFSRFPSEIWITPTMEALLNAFRNSLWVWDEEEPTNLRDKSKILGMSPHWDAEDYRLA